jgi:hypothetical protein
MYKIRILLVFFIVMHVLSLYAQDSIVLYSGKSILAKVRDEKSQTFISYQFHKGNKIKTKYLYKENIFAIYYHDSVSDMLYVPQLNDESPFTVEQMQSFVGGENLARYRYHPRWATICGTATGLAVIPLGIYGFLVPTAYVSIFASTPVKPLKKKYFPAEKVNDEFYKDGFKQEAKRKKLFNSVIGGVSGAVIIGTTLGIITALDYKTWGLKGH